MGSLDLGEFSIYESFLEGNMTKKPLSAKRYKANNVLRLIHTNEYGPIYGCTDTKGSRVRTSSLTLVTLLGIVMYT